LDLYFALFPLGEGSRMRARLDEAEALAEAVGDQRRLSRVLTINGQRLGVAGDYAAAIQTELRALAIGEATANVAIRVAANGYLGYVCVARGECHEAVRHCEAALALIPEGLAHERFGQDLIQASNVRTALAKALGAFGRFAEAFGRLREAMHVAEEAGHIYSLLYPLLGFGTLKLDQGDFAGAIAPLERGLDLCRTGEVPWLLHDFAWALGAAYHVTGRRAEGIGLMENAARAYAQRVVPLVAWRGRVGALGEAYLLAGRPADATRIAQDGLAAARQRGERGVEGRVLRLLGDIAAHPDRFEFDVAQAHYRQALSLAEELGLRPLVAHCHLGLGKLYRRMGKPHQAAEHLTPAATMFGEMDMPHWREQAEMVMTEQA
jgi:tetratricopeptide (TPR) repeat protein